MKKTIYGDEKTAIILSDKAEKAYAEDSEILVEIADPNDGSLSYAIYDSRNLTSRNLVRDGMTKEEVNEYFEHLYDEMQEERLKRRILDELDLSGTPEEYEVLGYLTVNELPSGRKVVWYLDDSLSLALDLATGEDVTSQAEAELSDGTVENRFGWVIGYDVAVDLMDDDLREELHDKLAPCTDQEFFDAYAKAHKERFGEEWELSKENPVY